MRINFETGNLSFSHQSLINKNEFLRINEYITKNNKQDICAESSSIFNLIMHSAGLVSSFLTTRLIIKNTVPPKLFTFMKNNHLPTIHKKEDIY